MKYSWLVVIALFSFIAPMKDDIKIKGLYTVAPKPGEKIYFAVMTDEKAKQKRILDSTTVRNNRFSFNLEDVKPGKYEIGNSGGQYFSIYLDYGSNSEIIIDSLFMKPRILGNLTDSLIRRFEALKMQAGLFQMGAGFMAMKYKQEGKEMPDSIVKQLQEGLAKATQTSEEFSRSTGLRKDMAAAYVLANGAAAQFTLPELNSIYSDLAPSVKQAGFGMAFKAVLDKMNNLSPGARAPVFTEKTPEGEDVLLTDFVNGKKLVLIDFWASWCGPCRKENPNVVALYNQYKEKGFDIIGVSLDSKKENWLEAIAQDKLTWMHVSDLGGWKSRVAQLYNVSAVPHTVLLDGNGVIIAKNLRGKDLEAKVEEICR